jgi:hypothetical protein
MAAGRGISKMRILGIVALGAALGGCASSSADIAPAYVSPVAYQGYTCQQLALEAQAISTRAVTLSGVQDSQHTKDGWTTAAAVVIFWPAAFLVGGDKQTAAELAPDEGSNGCSRAGFDRKEMRDPVSGQAARDVIFRRTRTQWKAIEIFPETIRPMMLPTISAAKPITQSAPLTKLIASLTSPIFSP